MNHFKTRFACLLLLLLGVIPDVLGDEVSGLRAGTAAIEISPDVTPFQLRSGRSSYVHDPLFVRSIAMENDGGTASLFAILSQ
ncbi:MAG: hypothetical protein F9B45_28325 [Phycisphaera sp. RhM]|nr:hypothetical protein [Phycisphaera sp. RhM]